MLRREVVGPWASTIASRRIPTATGSATATAEPTPAGRSPMVRAVESGPSDPYAELKARIHHACIAKLGPELFNEAIAEDLDDRVRARGHRAADRSTGRR